MFRLLCFDWARSSFVTSCATADAVCSRSVRRRCRWRCWGSLVALYQGFFFAEQSSPSEALRLISRHKVSLTNTLPASHGPRIASIEGVQAISAWSWFQGIYIDNKPENFFARFAVDPVEIQKVRQDYVAPQEQWTAFQRSRTGCAIGRAIAEKHKLKIGDRINITGDIYPVNPEFTVQMIFEHPKNTECMMFHREYLTELLKADGAEGDTVGTFSILARSPMTCRASPARSTRCSRTRLPDQDRERARVRPVVHGVHGQHQAVSSP
jgi:hypothetical protein